MHLAQDILHKVIDKAGTRDEGRGTRVTYVKIKLGAARFTHLDELKELFSQIAKGTAIEVARIDFEVIPLKAICSDCRTDFAAAELRLDCPHCGSTAIKISSGNELLIEELE